MGGRPHHLLRSLMTPTPPGWEPPSPLAVDAAPASLDAPDWPRGMTPLPVLDLSSLSSSEAELFRDFRPLFLGMPERARCSARGLLM